MKHMPVLCRWLANIVGCLFLMAIAGDASLLLGQDANYDLRNYHWYNAYAFLEGRMGYDIAPAQLQTYHNPILDIPYYWVATNLPEHPAYAAFLEGCYYGLLLFFLIKCALLLLPPSAGSRPAGIRLVEDNNNVMLAVHLPPRTLMLTVAVAVGASGAALISQFGTTTNEVPVAALVIAGFYCLLVSIDSDRTERWLFAAGCAFGAGAGLKLTAAVYAVAAVAALGAIGYRRGRAKKTLLLFLPSFAFGFLLFDGYWMLRLYTDFDNPLFPYYNHVFRSEWWEVASLRDMRFMPRDMWQWLFYPFYWVKLQYYFVMEAPLRDPRIAVVLAALVALAVGLVRSAPTREKDMWWLLLVFVAVSYVVWLMQFSIYRYLIPVEVLSGLVLAGIFRWLVEGRAAVLALAGYAIVAWTVYPDWGHVEFQHGTISAEAPLIREDSMVLLMGGVPASYVIPSFPKGVRFVGVGSNLIRPGMSNRLQRQVDVAILKHRGDFFFIEHEVAHTAENDGYLAHYRLRRGDCMPLATNLRREGDGLRFCGVFRDVR